MTTKKIYSKMNKDSKIKTTKISKNTIKNNKTLKRKPIKQFDVIDIIKESKNYNEDYINPFDTFEDKYEEELKKQNIDILVRNHDLEKKTLRQIHEALNTSKYNPVNDFYSYINDRWIKDIKLDESQKYIVQIDNFRLTQDKIYKQLVVLVENYLKEHQHSKEPFDISLRNFYKSFFKVRISKNDKNKMKNHIKNYLSEIDTLIQENNLWKMLAYVNELDVVKWGLPLIWTNKPDPKEPTIFRSYIGVPKLSLIDLTVYFDDGTNIEYKNIYKKKYIKYLKDLFEYSFGEDYYKTFNVNDVFEVEAKIAQSYACDNIKRQDNDTLYNKVTTKQAINEFHFNWIEFTKELGFTKTPDFFITPDLNYLFCVTQLLIKEWNTPQWRTFWIYLYARQLNRFDLGNTTPIYWDFFGKFQKGIEGRKDKAKDKKDLEKRLAIFRILMVSYTFNTFVSKLYIQNNINVNNVNYVKTLAEDLRTVFIRIIKKNNWLQPSTKKKALEKMTHLKFIIGYPDKYIEPIVIDFVDNDFWVNLTKISKFRMSKGVTLDGAPVINWPIVDWSEIPVALKGTQVYNANAFYTQTNNSIYVPLGYIQKPFVDLEERGIEYNLAHIGFTLAHEMSHALDSSGSKYDENGKLNNWWSNIDSKYFRKIQEDVVKQYETFASYDGIKFDAWHSIDENLADISAVNICCEYLRDFQMKNNDILPIVDLSFKIFFVYFAFQQRQTISKKAQQVQLITNPHPLNKYRVNCPLARVKLFQYIYNIKPGDKMFWKNTNKLW
jgi:predicted metalloendopeptidase